MALHDDTCWLDLNGWGGATDQPEGEKADECRLLREREVAGKSNVIPSCAMHGPVPKSGDTVTEPVIESGS